MGTCRVNLPNWRAARSLQWVGAAIAGAVGCGSPTMRVTDGTEDGSTFDVATNDAAPESPPSERAAQGDGASQAQQDGTDDSTMAPFSCASPVDISAGGTFVGDTCQSPGLLSVSSCPASARAALFIVSPATVSRNRVFSVSQGFTVAVSTALAYPKSLPAVQGLAGIWPFSLRAERVDHSPSTCTMLRAAPTPPMPGHAHVEIGRLAPLGNHVTWTSGAAGVASPERWPHSWTVTGVKEHAID
jgi:hypothetical protein